MNLADNLPDTVLATGAALVVVIRTAVAVTELRLRVPGSSAWRAGRAAAELVAHDVLAGLALFGTVAVGARWIASLTPANPDVVFAVTALGTGAALVLLPAVLQRRYGVGLRSLARPRRTVAEPCPTLREQILDRAERAERRATSRWIGARLERCRRDCGVPHEQLLPAVWPAVRLRLREEPGTPRTEVALLLLQAQAVADDASPAQERILTLLHLLHERGGRGAVTAALEQARRTPIRHGRPGAGPWGGPGVSAPVDVRTVDVPLDDPVDEAPEARTDAAAAGAVDGAAQAPAAVADRTLDVDALGVGAAGAVDVDGAGGVPTTQG